SYSAPPSLEHDPRGRPGEEHPGIGHSLVHALAPADSAEHRPRSRYVQDLPENRNLRNLRNQGRKRLDTILYLTCDDSRSAGAAVIRPSVERARNPPFLD